MFCRIVDVCCMFYCGDSWRSFYDCSKFGSQKYFCNHILPLCRGGFLVFGYKTKYPVVPRKKNFLSAQDTEDRIFIVCCA